MSKKVDATRDRGGPLCARCRCRHEAHDEQACRSSRRFVFALTLAMPGVRFLYHKKATNA